MISTGGRRLASLAAEIHPGRGMPRLPAENNLSVSIAREITVTKLR
jgi:hypothetical protein